MDNNGVPNKCYLCGGDDLGAVCTKMRYETISRPLECNDCGLIFLHPRMTPGEEKAYYEREYARIYAAEKGTNIAGLDEARESDAMMYFGWVKPHVVPGKDCLEAGCASGYFLRFLRRNGYAESVAGVEPHAELAAICKVHKIHVMRSIDDAGSRTFHYVFAFFLLEHLGDPVKFLRRASETCVHGGKIFIVVPNADDALLSTYRIPAFRDFYFTPAHQFYYSAVTLSAMLIKAGLPDHRIYHFQRYGLSNHMHWMMHGKPGGTAEYTDVHGTQADELYREQLCFKGLSDTIMAVVEVR